MVIVIVCLPVAATRVNLSELTQLDNRDCEAGGSWSRRVNFVQTIRFFFQKLGFHPPLSIFKFGRLNKVILKNILIFINLVMSFYSPSFLYANYYLILMVSPCFCRKPWRFLQELVLIKKMVVKNKFNSFFEMGSFIDFQICWVTKFYVKF